VAEKLHPEDLQAMIHAVVVRSPWMRADQAAAYLQCPVSRAQAHDEPGSSPRARWPLRALPPGRIRPVHPLRWSGHRLTQGCVYKLGRLQPVGMDVRLEGEHSTIGVPEVSSDLRS